MKIDAQGTLEASGLQSRQIGVDPEAISKIVGLLSRRMYSFPYSAFREAWLNARESHAKRALRDFPEDTTQGQQVIPPVEIVLPTSQSRNHPSLSSVNKDSFGYTVAVQNTDSLRFSIRDYGVGLSASELEELITNAGKSDKADDNTFGGGMGIGSLAGFSVADQIVYTAYKDGLKSVLVLSSDSNAFVVSDPVATDEADGVQLTYILRDHSTAHSFAEGAAEFLALAPLDERATIVCDKNCADILRDRRGRTFPRGEHGLHVVSERPTVGSTDSLNIRIDGCFYRGEHTGLADKITQALNSHAQRLHAGLTFQAWSHSSIFENVVWDVPPGHFPSISPNRETISLSKTEVETFIDLLIEYLDEYLALALRGEELADLLRGQALTASKELTTLAEFADLAQHPAFTRQGYYTSTDSEAVYASNFSSEVTDKVIAARAFRLPYSGSLQGYAGRGKHFQLAHGYGRRTMVELVETVYIPGKALGTAHTVEVDGKTYQVSIENEDKAVKRLRLRPFSAEEGKTLLRVASSSNQLDHEVWSGRISDMRDAELSKLDAEEKALVRKVTDDDAQVVVSVPSSEVIDQALASTGVTVAQVGEEIDGVALRKVYGKLFQVRRKATGTKYSVLMSPAAQSAVGAAHPATELDAGTLSDLDDVTLIHSPITLGGKFAGMTASALLSVVQAAHPGPVALVSRRTEQQSEKKFIEAVAFDGKVDDIDPLVALSALGIKASDLTHALDADSVLRLVRSHGAAEVGVADLPEFSAVAAAFVSEDTDDTATSYYKRAQRQNNIRIVLGQLSEEQTSALAAEYVGMTPEEVSEANNLAEAVLSTVNIGSGRSVLGNDAVLELVNTVIAKAKAKAEARAARAAARKG